MKPSALPIAVQLKALMEEMRGLSLSLCHCSSRSVFLTCFCPSVSVFVSLCFALSLSVPLICFSPFLYLVSRCLCPSVSVSCTRILSLSLPWRPCLTHGFVPH